MCTTIHVGRSLTLDNSSIHAHVEDMGIKAAGRLWHVPARFGISEDTLYVPYETIPQVDITYSYWASGNMKEAEGLGIEKKDSDNTDYDDVLVAMNEKGLVLSCNMCYSREPNIERKGIRRYAIRQLIPERCATAREGVELIAELIDKYGQADWGGLHYSLSDEKETWIVETTSYHWIARKLKDDEILAVANRFTIESDYDLASDDIESFAKGKGWFSGEVFSFRDSYSLSERVEKPYDTLREKRVYDKLKPLKHGIAVDDVMDVMSDRYEGTDKFRNHCEDIELWEDVCKDLKLPRPIATNLCQSSFITVQSSRKSEALGTQMWFSFGQPGCFGYVPVFKGSVIGLFDIIGEATGR